jgi:hypothetical protein
VRLASLALAAALAACGGGRAPSSPDGGGAPDAGALPDGGPESCLGDALTAAAGKHRVLTGASMEDATAAAAPFDVRYVYISGGLYDGAAPCASCASGCTSSGHSCANSAGGCAWWGCWQYDQVAPGQYATDFIGAAQKNAQVPMFTYYELLQSSGAPETPAGEMAAANDASFMARYLADFRFLAQRIGSAPAWIHVEPDFWGYAMQYNQDPHSIPARVASANPTDCAGLENSIAGLGRCFVAIARKYAPNAKVTLHGSGWATGPDVLLDARASLDVAAEGRKLGAFLAECGAGQGDFVAVDASDRDAAWYATQGKQTWWDPTDQSLPDFARAYAWSKALAETVGRPIVWWQTPVGNAKMGNTSRHWQDNRVDTFFAQMARLADAHAAAVIFGAGNGEQTTPETDGGNLISKVQAYVAGGGQPVCH